MVWSFATSRANGSLRHSSLRTYWLLELSSVLIGRCDNFMVGFFLADALNLRVFSRPHLLRTTCHGYFISCLVLRILADITTKFMRYYIHLCLVPMHLCLLPNWPKNKFKNKVKGQNLYKKTLQVTK